MSELKSAGARFRAAVREERPLQVVGAVNAYFARLAEHSGYKALYLSGGGVAACIAMRSASLTPRSPAALVAGSARRPARRAAHAPPRSAPAAGRFRGVALMEGYDTYIAEVVEVSMEGGEPKVHKVTVVADLGQMVNPDTVEAQIQSSVIFGLSAALYGEITVDKGRVQQNNFHAFRIMRSHEAPEIDIVLIPSTEKPGGIGEPATALVGPAVANAMAALTGKRVRRMPFTADNLAKA